MSHGSWFTILRDDNKQIADKNVVDNFFKENENILNDPLWNCSKTLGEINDFFTLNKDKHSILNVKNHKLYIELMNIHFNSEFDSFVKFYNMNAYDKSCQMVFSCEQAKKIIQAIDYITGEKYDKKFEKILNNEYLCAFEDLYPVFSYRNTTIDKSYYNSGEYNYQCEMALSIFKRISTILQAYVVMEDEDFLHKNEYLLVYTCY